jgi:hypothetical protein
VFYVCYIAKITEHVIATSLETESEWDLETLLLLVEDVRRKVLGNCCTEDRQCEGKGIGFGSHRPFNIL